MTLLTQPPPVEKIEHARQLLDRPLPVFCHASTRQTWMGLTVAALVVGLYGVMIFKFWAPADGGVDQNAYLLGGRMIAEHGTPRYTLPSPYAYVGNMFIRTSPLEFRGGDYFPKYPFGLPLLYASFFWIAGPARAAVAAFAVSPACSILAIAGMFFLARLIAGPFPAVMASILLATSQLTLTLAINANSHSSCMCFIVWGMYALLKWWQNGRVWIGILAGFLIGYAALIRYSEGLLILPISVACASKVRWTDWRSYLRCSVPGFAWLLPVGVLLIFNKHIMGNWTGYDSTNESEGFTWIKFTQTWEQMVRTYYDTGAFFVFPMGIAGLILIFRRSWMLGLMLLAWLLPGTALYTSYYWSPDRGVAYARFILTFLPVIMLGSAICFQEGFLAGSRQGSWYQRLPSILTILAIVGISGGIGHYRAIHGLQQGQAPGGQTMLSLPEEHHIRQNLANTGQILLKNVPVNSVLFADDSSTPAPGERVLNYIQFIRHWDVYASNAFELSAARKAIAAKKSVPTVDPRADANAVPTTRQPLQLDYAASLYEGKSSTELHKLQAGMIESAFKSGHGVFVLAQTTNDHEIRRAFTQAGKYKFIVVQTWQDLPPLPPDPVVENLSGNRKNRITTPRKNGSADETQTSWELLQLSAG